MKCLNCNTVFKPQRKSARFCGARCRVAFNRKSKETVVATEKVVLKIPGVMTARELVENKKVSNKSYKDYKKTCPLHNRPAIGGVYPCCGRRV